jgi:hypothetical protein
MKKLVFIVNDFRLCHNGTYLTTLCERRSAVCLGIFPGRKYRITFRQTVTDTKKPNSLILRPGLYWNWFSPRISNILPYFGAGDIELFLSAKFGKGQDVYGTFSVKEI